jgi:hypothetical protein
MKIFKKYATHLLIACLVLLATGNYAHAQSEDACTAQSIQGGYGFRVTGDNVALGAKFAIVGRFAADGQGHFEGIATESVSGQVGRTTFIGAYIVNADCTGAARFLFPNGVAATLDFVIVENGKEVLIIDSDQGTVESGVAKKQVVSHKPNQ